MLAMPFGSGEAGPGGWWILDEPELHLLEEEPINPDLAGWRRERMPELPETAYFSLAPDWICEVLSKSTEGIDREEKMPIYADHGVNHVWLADPIARTIAVYTLQLTKRWSTPTVHRGNGLVRLAPFDALEFDLAVLWAPESAR